MACDTGTARPSRSSILWPIAARVPVGPAIAPGNLERRRAGQVPHRQQGKRQLAPFNTRRVGKLMRSPIRTGRKARAGLHNSIRVQLRLCTPCGEPTCGRSGDNFPTNMSRQKPPVERLASLAHFALAKATAIEPAVTAGEPHRIGSAIAAALDSSVAARSRRTPAFRRPIDCVSGALSSISDDIALQKIRNNGKLQPMSNPTRPHAQSKVHPAWRLLTSRDQAPRKKSSVKAV